MSQADTPSAAPEPILLVHGTFASDDQEKGKGWWQRDSEFCRALEGKLQQEGTPRRVCVPRGQSFPYIPPWWKTRAGWLTVGAVAAGVAAAVALTVALVALWRTLGGWPTVGVVVAAVLVAIVAWRVLGNWLTGRLRRWFGGHASSLPSTGTTDPEAVFHWSGDNSETARRQAARLLLAHMKQFDARGPFHMVAHSHGGSVLWEALCLAVEEGEATPEPKDGNGAGKQPPALTRLKSWTTVGTPFLHFRPDYWRLAAILPFLALIALLVWQWPWFMDFWDQRLPALGQPWGAKAGGVILLYILGLLVAALAGRFAWSWYYYFEVVQKNPNLVPEVRQHQRDDIISTLIGLGFAAALLLVSAVWFLPHFVRFMRWEDVVPTLLAALWLVTAVVLVLLSFVESLRPWWRCLENRRRKEQQARAWNRFKDRYLCLSRSAD